MAWQSTYPSLSATQGRIKAFVLECYLCPTQVFFRTKTFLRKKSFLQKLREREQMEKEKLCFMIISNQVGQLIKYHLLDLRSSSLCAGNQSTQ